jgi:hypothetical protein
MNKRILVSGLLIMACAIITLSVMCSDGRNSTSKRARYEIHYVDGRTDTTNRIRIQTNWITTYGDSTVYIPANNVRCIIRYRR